MKILCDINIILDVLLKRENFFENSYKIFELINKGKVIGVISGISIDTIAYILEKNGKKYDEIKNILLELMLLFDIANIDKQIILSSLNNDFKDIEDSIQYESSISFGCEYIITRNKKDFKNSYGIIVCTASEFISNKIVKNA